MDLLGIVYIIESMNNVEWLEKEGRNIRMFLVPWNSTTRRGTLAHSTGDRVDLSVSKDSESMGKKESSLINFQSNVLISPLIHHTKLIHKITEYPSVRFGSVTLTCEITCQVYGEPS